MRRGSWALLLLLLLASALSAQVVVQPPPSGSGAGGGVGIAGTPSGNQLTYWVDPTTIGGTSSLNVQITDLDLTAATRTAPNRAGTTPPLTCAVGDTFFDTDATAGSNLLGCTGANIWTLLGGAGGSG